MPPAPNEFTELFGSEENGDGVEASFEGSSTLLGANKGLSAGGAVVNGAGSIFSGCPRDRTGGLEDFSADMICFPDDASIFNASIFKGLQLCNFSDKAAKNFSSLPCKEN